VAKLNKLYLVLGLLANLWKVAMIRLIFVVTGFLVGDQDIEFFYEWMGKKISNKAPSFTLPVAFIFP
jgi:hypothetical protein